MPPGRFFTGGDLQKGADMAMRKIRIGDFVTEDCGDIVVQREYGTVLRVELFTPDGVYAVCTDADGGYHGFGVSKLVHVIGHWNDHASAKPRRRKTKRALRIPKAA